MLLVLILIFLLINPKGLGCKEKGNFLGIDEIVIELKLVLSVLCLFFIVVYFSSFLFCSNLCLEPNESSFALFDWSFLHILLSNIFSLKLGSELSFDIFDSI